MPPLESKARSRAPVTLAVLVVLLYACAVWVRGSEIVRPPNIIWVANEAGTGTTLNKLVRLTGAPATGIVASAGDKIGVVGICASGCGLAAASATASIANWGNTSCVFDGATTAGNYVGISATAAGSCTDLGAAYPDAGQVIGRVLSTNGGGGTYPIVLFSADVDPITSQVWRRTGNTAHSTNRAVIWYRGLVIGDPSTLGSESITNGAFTAPGAEWSRTGDMALSGTAAVYTHGGGAGTLNQPNASLAVKMGDGKWYYMVYTVSSVTAGVTWTLPATVCDSTGGLNCIVDLAAGVGKVFQFKSAAAASTAAFLSNFTSTGGGVTIDDLSLKEVAGGDLMLSGSLYARGTTLYGGSGAITGVVRAGLSQGAANLWNWQNAAGTNLSFVAPNGTWQGPVYAVYSSSFGAALEVGVTTPKLVSMKAGDANTRLASDALLGWTDTTNAYSGTVDTSFARYSSGAMEVVSAATGKPAGLRAGTLAAVALASPAAPTVTPTCVPGVCNLTWSYTVEALAGDLTTTIPGAVGSTNLQNGTINAASYNTVTWAAVTGATKYTVRRTVSAGTPASLGALTTCTGITGLSCVDNGLVGDAGTAPTGNTTGTVIVKLETPAASAATCTAGAIWADTGYIYVCTASGTVERAAVAAW